MLWLGAAAAVLCLVPGSLGGAGRLYTEEDPLVILSSGSLKSAVTNSSSAWLIQFFSSWCGHCIQYSSTWKALAQDVKGTAAKILCSPCVRVDPDFIQKSAVYVVSVNR